ncbi:hypothetical protein BZM27_37475 [Paraburkholderia steynii]|uniref:Uncharacterized protein n=1 Tax=Paraburkholderia steynii TaxID=1245441 RepID=A0A4R0XDH1_9BURK|nr:hypothetical protein BZM27_37475 [Paraburkholderia steynii]
MNRFESAIGLIMLAVPLLASAKAVSDQDIKDPLAISKLVHSIPAFQGDLGSRFTAGGMRVESVWIHTLLKEDVAEDPMNLALGDSMIHFYTSGTPDAAGCRILGSPNLIKRGKKYIPQDRTGYWLLTGRCDF